jgi:hypothetical protein
MELLYDRTTREKNMKRPQHPAVHSDTVAPEIEEPAGSVEVADVATVPFDRTAHSWTGPK